jgi:hypothetical protein
MIYGAARREIKCWFLKNWHNEFIAPISSSVCFTLGTFILALRLNHHNYFALFVLHQYLFPTKF